MEMDPIYNRMNFDIAGNTNALRFERLEGEYGTDAPGEVVPGTAGIVKGQESLRQVDARLSCAERPRPCRRSGATGCSRCPRTVSTFSLERRTPKSSSRTP